VPFDWQVAGDVAGGVFAGGSAGMAAQYGRIQAGGNRPLEFQRFDDDRILDDDADRYRGGDAERPSESGLRQRRGLREDDDFGETEPDPVSRGGEIEMQDYANRGEASSMENDAFNEPESSEVTPAAETEMQQIDTIPDEFKDISLDDDAEALSEPIETGDVAAEMGPASEESLANIVQGTSEIGADSTLADAYGYSEAMGETGGRTLAESGAEGFEGGAAESGVISAEGGGALLEGGGIAAAETATETGLMASGEFTMGAGFVLAGLAGAGFAIANALKGGQHDTSKPGVH